MWRRRFTLAPGNAGFGWFWMLLDGFGWSSASALHHGPGIDFGL
jgi:hypothetical protein